VASKASVALGYLSEVERGQTEASSEILASVAEALDTPVSVIMREVGDRLAVLEGLEVPDALPADFGERFAGRSAGDRRPDLVAH
jgi:transcriptional regulator with XRE-family HTH domain